MYCFMSTKMVRVSACHTLYYLYTNHCTYLVYPLFDHRFWVPIATFFWNFLSYFGVRHDVSTIQQIEDFTLHSYHSCAGSFETIDKHRMSFDRVLPPLLLVHGERDDIVPVNQSRAFASDLRESSHCVELRELKRADHALITHPNQISETKSILQEWLGRF
jgi:acetyl esterase/lipase